MPTHYLKLRNMKCDTNSTLKMHMCADIKKSPEKTMPKIVNCLENAPKKSWMHVGECLKNISLSV